MDGSYLGGLVVEGGGVRGKVPTIKGYDLVPGSCSAMLEGSERAKDCLR